MVFTSNIEKMKKTSIWLLIVGVLGIAAPAFSMVKGASFAEQIPFFICGLSLIFGFFTERKKELKQE